MIDYFGRVITHFCDTPRTSWNCKVVLEMAMLVWYVHVNSQIFKIGYALASHCSLSVSNATLATAGRVSFAFRNAYRFFVLILNIYLVDVLFNKKDPQTQDRGTLVFASGPLANGSVRGSGSELLWQPVAWMVVYPSLQINAWKMFRFLLGQGWPIFKDVIYQFI